MSLSRRRFLAGTAAGVVAFGVHSSLRAEDKRGPNDKLRIAAVGCTGQAGGDLANISGSGDVDEVVAIADIDAKKLDEGSAKYKSARKYRDFRVMLEKEADKIDAVMVATPDHCHAPAAAMALRLKKHTFCEKPLTHTVFESRTLTKLALDNKLVTQMGSQIHAGDNYRRVVELIKGGVIGKVREAHAWVGVNYSGAKFTTNTQAPSNVDWDLWLGPAPQRPYSEGCHPFNWRRFWDYGTGGLGDFGCHYGDLIHWALDLRHPTKISTIGPPVDAVSCPGWTTVTYDHPARGEMPAVKYMWYDGSDNRPKELLATLKGKDGGPLKWGSGQLFIGETGMVISDYGNHQVLRDNKVVEFDRPKESIPRSIGHYKEWTNAIRTGGDSHSTTCNFDYSGALTEAVLLGTVSFRAGKPIEWDGAAFKITNAPDAEKWLHKEYRKGWTL